MIKPEAMNMTVNKMSFRAFWFHIDDEFSVGNVYIPPECC